jgi:hypothetical protein
VLDDLMEKTISAFLIEHKDMKKLLNGLNVPLETISSRIIMAYSL